MTSLQTPPADVRAGTADAPPAGGAAPQGHPRPDRYRSGPWQLLDGTWDLLVDGDVQPVEVPFAWETTASGVARTWLEEATYRRSLSVPQEWDGRRVVLCFGAVHHSARVLLDGREVAAHTGGSLPFEVDVTDVVAPGATAELAVHVSAPSDKRSIPHGKQRSIPRDDYDGVCFSPTSGIWQSVWLETRGRTHVRTAAVRGESLTGFDVSGDLAGDAVAHASVEVDVRLDGRSAGRARLRTDAGGHFSGTVAVEDPRTWSPASPALYRLELRVLGAGAADGAAGPDVLTVAAGLRRVEVRDGAVHLNGERLHLRGVLDQGYWPASGMTAPSEEALLADLDLARELGFNLVRKHIKLEDPRWLHRADVLGVLVWAEPPAPSRFSDEAAAAFEAQLAPMVARDGNHPSIIIWSCYNEEWGLDWDVIASPERAEATRRAAHHLRVLDPTRPVVDNSGWSHVDTDLVDWHYYDEDPAAWATRVAELADGAREDFPVRLGPDFVVDKTLHASVEAAGSAAARRREALPLLNSEYGAGFTSLERAWHLRWQTQELRRHDRFCGYVYTELTDVEHEMAGLVDADRRPKDLGGLLPADVNADTVLVVDLVPRAAGADITVPRGPSSYDVHVSHHGGAPLTGAVSAAWVASGTPFPASPPAAQATSEPVTAEPFALSPAVSVEVPAPGAAPSARLLLWLVDEAGEVRARTFVDAAPVEEANRRGATRPAVPAVPLG